MADEIKETAPVVTEPAAVPADTAAAAVDTKRKKGGRYVPESLSFSLPSIIPK